MEKFLPITVIAAMIIFIFKEGLELFRRRNAEQRKLRAIKILMAGEIELNSCTVKSLSMHLERIKSTLEHHGTVRVISQNDGSKRIEVNYESGVSGAVLPKTHRSILDRSLLDTGIVDSKLFDKALVVEETISTLDHLCDSLLIQIEEYNRQSRFPNLEGFIPYAESQIIIIRKDIDALYKACTGKDLLSHRVL